MAVWGVYAGNCKVHWSAGDTSGPQLHQQKENWADFSKNFTDSVDEDSDDQFRRQRSSSNSSAVSSSSGDDSDDEDNVWKITDEQKDYYIKQFKKLQPTDGGVIKGSLARDFFLKSGLPTGVLSKIWQLSDLNKDHALDLDEFCIAMHLVVAVRHGVELPHSLPMSLVPRGEAEQYDAPQASNSSNVSSNENLNGEDKLHSPGWANFSSSGEVHDSDEAQGAYNYNASKNTPVASQASTDEMPSMTSNFRAQPAAEASSQINTTNASRQRHGPLTHTTSVGSAVGIGGTNTPESRGRASQYTKKHSIEIARPRAAGGIVSLMDLGPGQLLPPPGRGKGRPPTKRLMMAQGSSPVTSPTSTNVPDLPVSEVPEVDSSKVRSRSETSDDAGESTAFKQPDFSQANRDESEVGNKQISQGAALPANEREKPVQPEVKDNDDTEVKLRRSSSRKSRPRSYTGDSRSSVELEHLPDHHPGTVRDFEHPPTPPPRAKKGHSRASSLDLNKLFGSRGGQLFDETTEAKEKATRDLSPPKKPPRTSIYKVEKLDQSPERETGVTESGTKTSQDTASKSIARPRPAPSGGNKTNLNHRRSASLDWGKEHNVALPPPKSTEGKDVQMKIYPKRAAPSPPSKNRAKSVERTCSPHATAVNDEWNRDKGIGVVNKSLENKKRKQELQARIRLLKEKNSTLSSINNELNQELREVMEARTSLELKTEKMKQSFNK